MLVCAEAITRAALARTESRGAHSRLDFPELSDDWGGAEHRRRASATARWRSTTQPGRRRWTSSSRSSASGGADAADEHAARSSSGAATRAAASFVRYEAEAREGTVVLDAVHEIQRTHAPDLAVRWNCKAAKCGSCGAEVNGKPRLMCKTRLDDLPADRPITRRADAGVPDRPRPRQRRLVELRGEQADPAVLAEARRRSG